MANLDKSAIVTDATIIAKFWTDLYDALTGDTIYDNVSSLIRGVKVYRIQLAFGGENDPQIVYTYENTLGGTVVWTRTDVGTFMGTLSGAFPPDKTHILMQMQGEWKARPVISAIAGNVVIFKLIDTTTGNAMDDTGHYCFIQILVYP